MEATHQQTPSHIIPLPSPGIGHIIPLTELAKRLILHSLVTFIIPTGGRPSKAQQDVLNTLPKSINYICLTPVDLTDLAHDAMIKIRTSLTVSRSLPYLRQTLRVFAETNRVAALVVDLFGTDAFDVAKEFNISSYLFFPSTAIFLSLALHLPKLNGICNGDYKDMPDLLKLPGCEPLHRTHLLDVMPDRSNDGHKYFIHQCKRFRMAEGMFVNTFLGLELGVLNALNDGSDPTIPPVYPVGPLIQKGSRVEVDDDDVECLRWLDDQLTSSVLFVSFESDGTLLMEQQNELALGLEMSEQKFLWVVKSLVQTSKYAAYFNAQSIQDPFAFLPEGLLERTKGRGLVVASWAPQMQVLGHGSIGGFITHCGWNSALESIIHGVPLIAWPLFADQKINSKILVEDLKVALKPKAKENGAVRRAEIAGIITCLMEGEEWMRIQSQTRLLQATAEKVLCEDGYTPKSLSEVVHEWKL